MSSRLFDFRFDANHNHNVSFTTLTQHIFQYHDDDEYREDDQGTFKVNWSPDIYIYIYIYMAIFLAVHLWTEGFIANACGELTNDIASCPSIFSFMLVLLVSSGEIIGR